MNPPFGDPSGFGMNVSDSAVSWKWNSWSSSSLK
jgi:hypothetical protein